MKQKVKMAVGERSCVLCGIKGIRGYHHFPKNKAQRQTWLKHCGLNAENVKENDKICFRHFKPDDYFPRRSDNQVRILKKYIVPTRNLPKVSKPQYVHYLDSKTLATL